MTVNLHLPTKSETLRPTITVIGIGGAGGNAVNNMISAKLEGVSFVVANTDAQALEHALTDRAIQLGAHITRGLGAGASPEVGRAAAEEAIEEINEAIQGSNMVFIAAGMGGGTGTGAAPVVARLAREQGILTVGVVTKPFSFEGTHRMRLAESGLSELQQYVDTMIVIPNQNLFRVANERTSFAEAFRMADEVLHTGVRGITDLIVKPGLVNLDFADIRTVMREMGKAMMGTGEATGDNRAVAAAEAAISNPLLDDVSLKGAKAVLINITGGLDLTLWEADEAAGRIREEVDPDANIIFGTTFHDSMQGSIRVSVVATGIDAASQSMGGSAPRTATVPVNTSADVKRPFSFAAVPAARPEPIKAPAAVATAPVKPAPVYEPVREPSRAAPQPQYTEQQQEPQRGFAFAPQKAAEPAFNHVEASFSFSEPRTSVGNVAELDNRVSAKIAEDASGPRLSSGYEDEQNAPVAVYQAPRKQPHQVAREESAALSFFQKMAGVGRALSRGEAAERKVEKQERPIVSEKPRPEVVADKAPHKAPVEEEYLDIPAFLRRQAN